MSEPLPVHLILGSRSPRRLELLSLLLPPEQIVVLAAPDETEPGFEGCTDREDVLDQLALIAFLKNEAVREEIAGRNWGALLTADTVVMAQDETGRAAVLGKPDGPDWQARVREWFHRYYLGRTHEVATAVCLWQPDGTLTEFHVITEVSFAQARPELVDWYVATDEPLGKAGGYAVQGAGGMFVDQIRGSLSNVIGLPLEATWKSLRKIGLIY